MRPSHRCLKNYLKAGQESSKAIPILCRNPGGKHLSVIKGYSSRSEVPTGSPGPPPGTPRTPGPLRRVIRARSAQEEAKLCAAKHHVDERLQHKPYAQRCLTHDVRYLLESKTPLPVLRRQSPEIPPACRGQPPLPVWTTRGWSWAAS